MGRVPLWRQIMNEDAELILALWETLTQKEQSELKPRLKIKIGRPPTQSGRSDDPFYKACRSASLAVLKLRRSWLEAHQSKTNVPIAITRPLIHAEIQKRDVL